MWRTIVARVIPVLISNACLLYGVLFLHWSVADIYFWFWYEVALAGGLGSVLVCCCQWSQPRTHPRHTHPFLFVFAYLLVMFYATLFAGVAYMQEWKSWSHFPEFLAGKEAQMLVTLSAFGVGMTALLKQANRVLTLVEMQFTQRAAVIVILYAILIFQHHFTGAERTFFSGSLLTEMAILLIALKMIAELGIFDRLLYRRFRQE